MVVTYNKILIELSHFHCSPRANAVSLPQESRRPESKSRSTQHQIQSIAYYFQIRIQRKPRFRENGILIRPWPIGHPPAESHQRYLNGQLSGFKMADTSETSARTSRTCTYQPFDRFAYSLALHCATVLVLPPKWLVEACDYDDHDDHTTECGAMQINRA